MPQAIWNNTVIAESDETEVVEGNHYFPPDSIHREYFRENSHTTVCGWKGTASYYDLVIDDATNEAAAWFYADPKPEAASIKGYIAFWKGVQVNARANRELTTSAHYRTSRRFRIYN